MNFKHFFYQFWYVFWFVALPLAAAWAVVDTLSRTNKIEEVEVWYVLLLFALFAFGIYSIRNKLPFWRPKDKLNPYHKKRRAKEAQKFHKTIKRLLAKKGDRVSKRGKQELNAAMDALAAALASKDDDQIAAGIKKLEDKSNRFLAFAQKSAGREYFESIGLAVIVALVLRLFVVEAFKIPSESMVPTLMVGDHIFVSKYRYGLSLPFIRTRLVRFARPAHGEVVVFVKPSPAEQKLPQRALRHPFANDDTDMVGKDFIKRIVGLPGDKVEIKKDVLFINNAEIPRCRVGSQVYRTKNHMNGHWEDDQAELWLEKHGEFTYTIIEEPSGHHGRGTTNFGPVIVPDDQVFVLGDNRDNSNDSRYWGTVPFDNIKGRAMFIWWSNRRPHGFQWNRVGTFIMNEPTLAADQRAALEQCSNLR